MSNWVYTVFLFAACLTGCGSNPVGIVRTPTKNIRVGDLSDGSGSDATPVQLTYYRLTQTRAEINGWPTKTYAATGSCVQYSGDTYCWDDGIKTLSWVDLSGNHYGPYQFTYWNVGPDGAGGVWKTNGGLVSDSMTAPTFISVHLANVEGMGVINQVLTTGIPKTVSCTLAGSNLECGDFVIDLNQSPL